MTSYFKIDSKPHSYMLGKTRKMKEKEKKKKKNAATTAYRELT